MVTPSFFLVSLSLNVILVWFLLARPPSVKHITFSRTSKYAHLDAAQWFKKHPIDFENATAIFNTVSGAMKLKDMNLAPVGVSFIPAYVPPNTLMYHSTMSPEIPNGYDWIAMDYEFSYDFAVFDRGKGRKWFSHDKRSGDPEAARWGRPKNNAFLYTFRNTKPLDKVIYLDGASAAKTKTGEMDQQLILSRQEDIDRTVNEYEAAAKICAWGKDFGLQGVVRLEVGFEMILCDFHDGIELVANVSLNNVTNLAHLPWEKEEAQTPLEKKREELVDSWDLMHGFEHARAGAIVNDGDDRIQLDFSKMVTPLNRTWLNPDPYLRRIHNLSDTFKEELISEIENQLKTPVEPSRQTDWQSLASRMQDKFAPLLIQLDAAFRVFEEKSQAGDVGKAIEGAVAAISKITFNFVRRYSDNYTANEKEKEERAYIEALKDYVYHTFPLTTKSEGLIYSSVYRVGSEVISTIFDLFYTSRDMMGDIYVHPDDAKYEEYSNTLLEKKRKLSDLIKTLRWSIFTRCSELCSWDEICYAPTWGIGPINWGANDKYFEHDGVRWRIPSELKCVSFKDAGVL